MKKLNAATDLKARGQSTKLKPFNLKNEAEYTQLIRKYLDKLGGKRVKSLKFHGTRFSERGTPDMFGSFNGRMFLIESKFLTNLSDVQKVRLSEWAESGALAFCADARKGLHPKVVACFTIWACNIGIQDTPENVEALLIEYASTPTANLNYTKKVALED